MSPFDLRGPEFLLFYLIVSTIALVGLFTSRRWVEPSGPIKVDLSDPYVIAYLRGGKNELLRVSTISLIHRGLLKVSGTNVSMTSPHVADGVRIPLERELLSHFKESREASSVFSEAHFSSGAEPYGQSLERLGLLPDDAVRTSRRRILGLALVVLWGVAGIKIVVALSRGRTNIGFLILLSILFAFAAYKVTHDRLTFRGKAMLGDLQLLFGSLRDRVSTGFNPNELALLAAVFGIAALPISAFPYAQTLYPKAASSRNFWDGSSNSSCGSSGGCGSGGDAGGGGGCGGGGGGGCGGCGS